MDFPVRPCEPVANPPGLVEALRVAAIEVLVNSFNYMAVLESAQVLRKLVPDMVALACMDRSGVIVTAPGDGTYDFVSRERGYTVDIHPSVIQHWLGCDTRMCDGVMARAEQGQSLTRPAREVFATPRWLRAGLNRGCLTRRCAAILIALPLLASAAPADAPTLVDSPGGVPSGQTSSKDVGTIPQVTVEAQRKAVERTVDTFVANVTRVPVGSENDPLERWQAPICPLVAGLRREEGEFILTRLSEIITAAGAPLAPPKCRPNFYVVVTPNPELLLKKWSVRSDDPFGDSPETIREFINKPRPVRIWYNAELVSADGSSFGVAPELASMGGMAGTAFANTPANESASFSHIEFGTVHDFSSVIAIVDFNRLTGLEWGQLADYVAMMGLAKVNPDADVASAPTILRLFASPKDTLPRGLSPWDTSFLKALYDTRQNVRGQRVEIAGHILRDIAP